MAGGAVCVGCGLPVAYELMKGKKVDRGTFVFEGAGQVSLPILTCKSVGSNVIDVSLIYKLGADGKKELHWKGFDQQRQTDVGLEDIITARDSSWELSIFPVSKKVRIAPLSGGMGEDNYDDQNLFCNEDVLEVTKEADKHFDKGFNKIKLTLDNCKEISGKEECEINISKEVGLGWKPNFKPKAIFLI